MMELTKTCIKCGIIKSISEFHKKKSNKDGHDYRCRECRSEYRTGYYRNNQGYYKEYRIKNKERFKEYNRLNAHHGWAGKTIANHRKMGFHIDISINDLTILAKATDNCPLCGIKLNWNYGTKTTIKYNSPSLDRINNGNIISKDNIQILCFECNKSKGRRTLEELDMWCKGILERHGYRVDNN